MSSSRFWQAALTVSLALSGCFPEVPIGQDERDGSMPDVSVDVPLPDPDGCDPCGPAWSTTYTRVVAQAEGAGGGPFDVVLDVYLPDGTEDGSRILVRDPAFRRYPQFREGTLSGGVFETEWYGTTRFVVTDPCLTMTFGTFQGIPRPGTDQLLRTDPVERFCPVAGDPPTEVLVRSSALAGLGLLSLTGPPLDPSSFGGAVARVGATAYPLTLGGSEGRWTLELTANIEPDQVVTIELPGLRTLDGSPATPTVELLTTSAVLVDLDFIAVPPAASVAWFGYEPMYVDGTLRVEDEGGGERASELGLLLALGDVGTATEVRVEGTVPSRSGSQTQLLVYREGGSRSASVRYTGDTIIAIPPGTGAVWLAVANEMQVPSPEFGTGPLVFTIDTLTLLD